MKKMGARLKHLISERRLTQKETAEAIGVTPQFISHLIKGRTNASAETESRLAEFLGVHWTELYEEPAQTEPPPAQPVLRVIEPEQDEFDKFILNGYRLLARIEEATTAQRMLLRDMGRRLIDQSISAEDRSEKKSV